jgi:hypothetical protein
MNKHLRKRREDMNPFRTVKAFNNEAKNPLIVGSIENANIAYSQFSRTKILHWRKRCPCTVMAM